MQNRRLHARLPSTPDCRAREAVQFWTKAWSALPESISSESIELAYFPFFIYERKMALLRVIVFRSDDFFHVSQRRSLDGVRNPVETEDKVNKAARKCAVAVGNAMCLLALHFRSHLRALLGNNSLYTFDDDNFLEWNDVRKV